MARWIVRRVLHALVLIVLTITITFVVLHLAPGDPVSRLAAPEVDPAVLARMRRQLGLDDPLYLQFFRWVGRFLRGDFGNSLVHHRPVARILAETIPRTLLLTGLAFLAQICAGGWLGLTAAFRRGRAWDRVATTAAVTMYALPTFYIAYLLIMVFSLWLGVLPTGGAATIGAEPLTGWAAFLDRARHLVLPVAVLGIAGAAGWARYTRGAVIDELGADHIRTVRAKGAGEKRVLGIHAFRGALPQLITLLGVSVPYLLAGAVVVERVFALPGMGSLVVESILARDYPVVLAANFLAAVVVIASNLAADVCVVIADPRIKLASPGSTSRAV